MNRHITTTFCPIIKSRCNVDCWLWQPEDLKKRDIGECLGIEVLKVLPTPKKIADELATQLTAMKINHKTNNKKGSSNARKDKQNKKR